MVKKRNKYTAEFKQEAVGLVMEHGYSYADERSLGVHGNYFPLETGAFRGSTLVMVSPEQQRIHELEKENAVYRSVIF